MRHEDPSTMIAWLTDQVGYYLEEARHERNRGGWPGPERSVETARFFNRMLLHLKRGLRPQED